MACGPETYAEYVRQQRAINPDFADTTTEEHSFYERRSRCLARLAARAARKREEAARKAWEAGAYKRELDRQKKERERAERERRKAEERKRLEDERKRKREDEERKRKEREFARRVISRTALVSSSVAEMVPGKAARIKVSVIDNRVDGTTTPAGGAKVHVKCSVPTLTLVMNRYARYPSSRVIGTIVSSSGKMEFDLASREDQESVVASVEIVPFPVEGVTIKSSTVQIAIKAPVAPPPPPPPPEPPPEPPPPPPPDPPPEPPPPEPEDPPVSPVVGFGGEGGEVPFIVPPIVIDFPPEEPFVPSDSFIDIPEFPQEDVSDVSTVHGAPSGDYFNSASWGLDSKTSKVGLIGGALSVAQNIVYRERGAFVKRNGYTQINNSQPVN